VHSSDVGDQVHDAMVPEDGTGSERHLGECRVEPRRSGD
jgi:hypothetical protein